MLETIAEYAQEKLEASGEAPATRRRHALAFIALAERAEPHLEAADRERWVRRLVHDQDNLRVALRWTLESGEADLSCRLAAALLWFWYPQGKVPEGRAWVERALRCSAGQPDSVARKKALFTAGQLAFNLGDTALSRRRFEECARLCQELDDNSGLARARMHLGLLLAHADPAAARTLHEQALTEFRRVRNTAWVALTLLGSGHRQAMAGDTAAARVAFRESLELYRAMGDAQMAAEALNGLGDLARAAGDDDRAGALYTQGLELLRQLGTGNGLPGVLQNLGYVAQHRGEVRTALGYCSEALTLYRTNADERGIAECFAAIATIAATGGLPARAARLFGAAEVLLETADLVAAPPNVRERERAVAATRAQLDGAMFAAAWASGRALHGEQAVGYALATMEHITLHSDPHTAIDWHGRLTPRQQDVAALLVRGWSNRQIATQLVITEQTAETHVKRILHRLELDSRQQVRAWLEREELWHAQSAVGGSSQHT